jgi:DNA-binding transcriptional LysR family regulator
VKLQHLRSFVIVFQERSFTSAALRIYATQSGLSMQIKELEEDLGVQLFERSTRGVLPTAAGIRYYDRALKVLQELDEARREMRSLKGEMMGSVRVGIMPTISRAALVPALQEFAETHSHVSVTVTEAYSGALTEGVAREDFDFAIVPPVGGIDPRVESQFVYRDRELFVMQAGQSLRHLTPVSLRRYGPLKLVVPSRANTRRTRLDEYLTAIDAKVESRLELDAMMGTIELLAVSNWTAILPAMLCYPDREGLIRSLHPIVDPPLSVDYVRITPVSRKLSPAALAFDEMLTRQIHRIGREWETRLG